MTEDLRIHPPETDYASVDEASKQQALEDYGITDENVWADPPTEVIDPFAPFEQDPKEATAERPLRQSRVAQAVAGVLRSTKAFRPEEATFKPGKSPANPLFDTMHNEASYDYATALNNHIDRNVRAGDTDVIFTDNPDGIYSGVESVTSDGLKRFENDTAENREVQAAGVELDETTDLINTMMAKRVIRERFGEKGEQAIKEAAVAYMADNPDFDTDHLDLVSFHALSPYLYKQSPNISEWYMKTINKA